MKQPTTRSKSALGRTDIGGAEHHVGLSRIPREQRRKGGEQHRVRRRIELPGQRLDARAHLVLDEKGNAGPPVALERGAGNIADEFKRRSVPEPFPPPLPERRAARSGKKLLLGVHMVGKRRRQGWQTGRAAMRLGPVQGAQIVEQETHRAAIERNVMDGHEEHVVVRGAAEKTAAKDGVVLQVKREVEVVPDAGLELPRPTRWRRR